MPDNATLAGIEWNKRVTSYLVTRHPGAVEWVERKCISVDRRIHHLESASIEPGDIVIGILPVNLAAEVCVRGGRYLNLSLDLPPEARGKELSVDELDRYSARLEGYVLEKVQC